MGPAQATNRIGPVKIPKLGPGGEFSLDAREAELR